MARTKTNSKLTKRQLLEQAAALIGLQAAERQRRVEAQAHVNASKAPASDPLHAADDDDRGAVAGAAGADEEVDDEDSGTSLYNLYKPKRLAEGSPHPDPIVETGSLAGVMPPEIKYTHHLQDAVATRALSDLQLESIVYANMKFDGPRLPDGSRAGFFLGDGAGVGKGRQIAGLIYEYERRGGRRVLWVSVSADLWMDARRDLDDMRLEPHIEAYPSKGNPLPKLSESFELAGIMKGVVFCTYSLLVAGSGKPDKGENGELVLSPNEPRSRLNQIVKWLKGSGKEDPLIVFDECHKAKNLLSGAGQATKTALAVVALQKALPQARVLYCSATGASEPKNLAYMTRLGTFGHQNFKELLDALTGSGMGALEMFAMGLKATGSYVCRTLSYQGAEFEVASCEMSPEMKTMYDRSTDFWKLLARIFTSVDDGINPDGSNKKMRMVKAQFWGAHQRFFRQMLLCAKVPNLAKMAMEAVHAKNMCVVIGLQSTGEANMSRALADNDGQDLNDFVSAPMMVVQHLIKTQFPTHVPLHENPRFESRPGRLAALFRELQQIMQGWKNLPSISTAAQENAGNVTMSRRSGNEAGERSSNQLGDLSDGEDAAEEEDDDDDDDVVCMKEMSFDEVMAAKKQQAILTGNMLDLTEDASPAEMEALAKAGSSTNLAADKAILAQRQREEQQRLEREKQSVEKAKQARPGQPSGPCLTANPSAATTSTGNKPPPPMTRRPRPTYGEQDDDDDADDDDDVAIGQRGMVGEHERSGGVKRVRLESYYGEAPSSPSTLPKDIMRLVGRRVEVFGMTGRVDLNGATGMATEYKVEEGKEGRMVVMFEKSAAMPEAKQLALKVVNIRLHPEYQQDAPMDESASKPAAAALTRETVIGRRVLLEGLPTSSFHNGRSGMCVAEGAIAGYFTVEVDAKQPITKPFDGPCTVDVKLSNMVLDVIILGGPAYELAPNVELLQQPPPTPQVVHPAANPADPVRIIPQSAEEAIGKMVVLTGLVAAPTMNGASGLCTGVEPSNGRLVIKLDTVAEDEPKTVTIKLANVLLKPDPPPVPPSMAGGSPKRKRGSADTAELPHSRASTSSMASNRPSGSNCNSNVANGGDRKPNVAASTARTPRMRRQAAARKAVESIEIDSDFEMSGDEAEERHEEDDDSECEDEIHYDGVIMKKDPWLMKIRALLLKGLVFLELPPNPIDHLTDLCGGHTQVAEMTGRIKQQVTNDAGGVDYVKRCEGVAQKGINIKERGFFQEGKKFIAIISEAASTGISLQADRRVENQRRRLHITLELPWSADKAIQQFGRSHRSNQVSAPIFRILVTPCGGERRFASAAAKRLQSLGALLKGDRRALGAGMELKAFDIDNKMGSEALERLYSDLQGATQPMMGVTVPNVDGGFVASGMEALKAVGIVAKNKTSQGVRSHGFTIQKTLVKNVGVFLNRLLGCSLKEQKMLFDYFSSTLEAVVKEHKADGSFDDGIVQLKCEGITVAPGYPRHLHTDPLSGASTNVIKLLLDRAHAYPSALEIYSKTIDLHNEVPGRNTSSCGFWKSTYMENFLNTGKPRVLMATERFPPDGKRQRALDSQRWFTIRQPNIDGQPKSLLQLKDNWCKITDPQEAKALWTFWHGKFGTGMCTHAVGKCPNRGSQARCSHGARFSDQYIISGAVLPVWKQVQVAIKKELGGAGAKREGAGRVIRCETTDTNERLIGLGIPGNIVEVVAASIRESSAF